MSRPPESTGASFFERTGLPIGLQLYTLGELLQKDFPGTLRAVSATGYRSVELAGLLGRTPAEFRAALDAAGLKCTSAHVSARSTAESPGGLDGDLTRLAADLRTLGAEYAVLPGIDLPRDADLKPRPGESGLQAYIRVVTSLKPEDWQRCAGLLNQAGKNLRQSGIKIAYHNHNYEFAPVGNTTGFDILLNETDPETVAFELDVGWVTAAGLDPATLLNRSPGRYRLMHVKDVKKSTPPNFTLELQGTEVGSGVVDWQKVLPAAHAAGVRHFYVEQEPPFAIPRLESIEKSHAFLKRITA